MQYYQEEQVREGIALMESVDPGSTDRIDLDKLNIASQYACALGQAFGSYIRGLAKLELGSFEAYRYGFVVPPDYVSADMLYHDASALTTTWKKVLGEYRVQRRLAEVSAAF